MSTSAMEAQTQDLFEHELDQEEDLVDAEVSLVEVVAALKYNAEFFIQFFLGASLIYAVPKFHVEIFEKCKDKAQQYIVLAVPRGFAKTTIAKLVAVWYILFTDYKFLVYLGKNSPAAKNAAKDILAFLRLPNCEAVFGRLVPEKESETEGYWIFRLGKKRVILAALGAGQTVRGLNVDNTRPELAITDDMEDYEETQNIQEHINKNKRWYYRVFLKAMSRKNRKVLYLGNMVEKNCLLEALCNSPMWTSYLYGCIVRDKVTGKFQSLWPDMFPLSDLLEDFAEHQRQNMADVFFTEMLNAPGYGTVGYNVSQLHYDQVPDLDDITAAWLTIDPAFSVANAADKTAIAAHVLRYEKPPMTVAYAVERMEEHEKFAMTVRLARQWRARYVCIESTAGQRALITAFKLMAVVHRVHDLEFVPISAGPESKTERINALVAMLGLEAWALPVGDFLATSQFLSYRKDRRKNDDDLIDAISMGPRALEVYMPSIVAAAGNMPKIEAQTRTAGELAYG